MQVCNVLLKCFRLLKLNAMVTRTIAAKHGLMLANARKIVAICRRIVANHVVEVSISVVCNPFTIDI